MEIRPRGLQKTTFASVTAESFIDWIDILVKEEVLTAKEGTRILSDVMDAMDEKEGNFKLFDVRILLGAIPEPFKWTPEAHLRWESLVQRFADDIKEPMYTSFYVVA
jgi:desulfoferrodoxin (superoxide reductase-like protein)